MIASLSTTVSCFVNKREQAKRARINEHEARQLFNTEWTRKYGFALTAESGLVDGST